MNKQVDHILIDEIYNQLEEIRLKKRTLDLSFAERRLSYNEYDESYTRLDNAENFLIIRLAETKHLFDPLSN